MIKFEFYKNIHVHFIIKVLKFGFFYYKNITYLTLLVPELMYKSFY